MNPGLRPEFTIRVENANDTSVAFDIDPEGGHAITGTRRISRDTYAITVATSPDAGDFPALLMVTSLSDRGLRARPDAPVRSGSAILSSGATMEIDPKAACLEWGETLQFEAEMRGYPDSSVSWSATAGHISGDGLFTAPDEDVDVTVTAASDSDARVWASSFVTVAEECRCWAALDLPESGIRGVGDFGRVAFRDGDEKNLGVISEIAFSRGDLGGSLKLHFNGEPPRSPELPDIQEGKRADRFIFYDVETVTEGNVTFMSYIAISEMANPHTRWGPSRSFPDHKVLIDEGPAPGETGTFNIGFGLMLSDYPAPSEITTVRGGYNVVAYPAGAPNKYTLGRGDRKSTQRLATVVRPLWKDALSGDVYDTHVLQYETGERPILPHLIVPELTLHLEQFERTDDPDQFRIKGTVTGRAAVTYQPRLFGSPDNNTVSIEPLRLDFRGVFQHGSEFKAPYPDPDMWVCMMPPAGERP